MAIYLLVYPIGIYTSALELKAIESRGCDCGDSDGENICVDSYGFIQGQVSSVEVFILLLKSVLAAGNNVILV